jgi:uncharacterized membrane protein
MAKVVKAVGSEVNKGLNRLTYTNPITWGVVPGVITGILILTVIAVLQVPLTGESEVTVCKTRDGVKDCENNMVSNRWNILWYILAPLIGGAIIGGLIFKLGFMIHNPKSGAAIVGVGMMRQAITGK